MINKVTEERGCFDDLIQFLNLDNNKDNRRLNDENDFSSGSSTDECLRLGTSTNGMSLCQCTNHLCNSSSKQIHFSYDCFPSSTCSQYLSFLVFNSFFFQQIKSFVEGKFFFKLCHSLMYIFQWADQIRQRRETDRMK
jgi:hypothetical protein